MKNVIITLLFVITSYLGIAQNVGIGTTSPNASAQLDVSSTNSGFLPPRMTYAQRNAIVNPAAGLIVYCTDCANGEMQYFNGTSWINMSVGIGSIPFTAPIVSTKTTSSITTNGAVSGGNITSNGGASITARGVCWSTSVNPTIALATKTNDGNGIGLYTSTLTGLTANTSYHVRAYATNSVGTSYGGDSSFTTASPIDVVTGLVAYYPFNGNANDASGNGNNGTVYGASLTSDRNGNPNNAYSFNGAGNYISVPYSNSIGVQQNITISFWVYFNGGSCGPRIIQSMPWGNCGGFYISSSSNSNVSRYFDGGLNDCSQNVITSSPFLSALNWHHVVWNASGLTGISKFYFDGNLVTNTSTNNFLSSINYNNHPITIGNVDPNSCDWFGGFLDEIKIYNRVLNDSDVMYLYSH